MTNPNESIWFDSLGPGSPETKTRFGYDGNGYVYIEDTTFNVDSESGNIERQIMFNHVEIESVIEILREAARLAAETENQ